MKEYFENILNNKKQSNGLVLLSLLLISIIYFIPSMQQFPAFVHAWTQSDRLAIAICFQQNGFDLFHPCNFNLITEQGITAIDFPIIEFTVALVAELFNSDIVFTFRLINLLIGLTGIYYVYLLFAHFSKSSAKGLLMAIFTITLPFFAYYLNGFLPSSSAFSFLIIGLFYWLKYKEINSSKSLITALLFTSLAALIRLPFVIPLFAILGVWVLSGFKNKKLNWTPILGLTLGLLAVIGYWFYNHHLGSIYGNIFLSKFLYISSFSDLTKIIGNIQERWMNEYFTPYHYVLIISALLLSFKLTFKAKNRTSEEPFLTHFLWINSIGVLLFFFAMGKQFVDHDYYFLDTFLPIIVLFTGLIISKVNVAETYKKATYAFLFIFIVGSIGNTKVALNERYKINPTNRTQIAYNAYLKGSELVEKHQIDESATFLALDAYTTNSPFILLNRKGVAVLNTDSISIRAGLKLNLNYNTLLDTFLFSDVYQNYPAILYQLDYIDQTDQLRLYQKSSDTNQIGFFNQLHHYCFLDFSVDSGSIYDGFSNYMARNGESLQLNENTEYGLTYSQQINTTRSDFETDVIVDVDVLLADSTATSTLVIAIDNQFYQPYYLENEVDTTGVWNHLHLRTQLPQNIAGELKVYFWNPERKTIDYDNFRLLIAQ